MYITILSRPPLVAKVISHDIRRRVLIGLVVFLSFKIKIINLSTNYTLLILILDASLSFWQAFLILFFWHRQEIGTLPTERNVFIFLIIKNTSWQHKIISG
jgi:hypothetical protein